MLALLATAPQDHAGCTFVLARLITLGRLTPRTDRVAAAGCLTLATAVRMVYRVHHHAAHCRTHTAPAHRARLAYGAQVMLRITDFADSRLAFYMNSAHLAGTKPQRNIRPFLRH